MVGAPAAAYYRRVAFGVIGVSGLVCGTVAHAGDWTITPRISASEVFTDNSGLNTDNEERQSDFVTQVSPGLSITGTGGRTSLNLDYSFDQSFYHRNTQGDENSNTLAALGQVELWKRIFFVEGRASISQVIVDDTEGTSISPAGRNINRTEARTFNISPFIRQHLGQWLELEPRFTFNRTTTESDVVDDTKTRTGTITVNSGRRFALFPWSIVAFDKKTQNDGSEPSELERRIDGSLSYVLHRQLTLTGAVGWEDVRDPGLDTQPKGITWSGGFTARPSSRSSLQFSYGERNDEREVGAEASYRLSERTSVNASFSESIQTSQDLIANALRFLAVDTNNNLIDTRTGGPATADTIFGFGLDENTFRQQLFRLGFSGTRRRNSFFGSAFWEKRDTEATDVTEKSFGGNFSVTRDLSPRLRGSVGVAVQTTDFGTTDDREEIDYSASTSLSYQVRNDIRATVSYNLTLTKVNNAPDDLMENSVAIGLTKSF